jgi:hypothetical protein
VIQTGNMDTILEIEVAFLASSAPIIRNALATAPHTLGEYYFRTRMDLNFVVYLDGQSAQG